MLDLPIVHVSTRIMRIIVLLIIFAAPKDIHSWDLAVTSKTFLSLLNMNGSVEHSILLPEVQSELLALAYDPVFDRFFISTNDDNNASIIIYDMKTNFVTPIVPTGKSVVHGIAFDLETQILYWTDGNDRNIWKHSVKTADIGLPVKPLLHLPTQVPLGIAVSSCHRGIFWANSNHTSPSLDRADLDGSSHVQIATKDLFMPLGVTIDEAYGKIYWTDDRPGIYYRIERCGLDGTGRELVLQRTNQDPFNLALMGTTIFWTDTNGRKLWSLSTDMTFPNHTHARLEPDLFFKFDNINPVGIALNRNTSESCEPVKILRTIEVVDEVPYEQTVDENMASDFCLNLGELFRGVCRCKRGFSGRRCEVPICHNHCLHEGNCYIDRLGYADCHCLPGYEGRRCERDVCDDFCLSGGRCYVEAGQPICSCPDGTNGRRCEVSARLAAIPSFSDIPLFAALGAVACALLVVVVILTWRVIVLRRRPRVKKRFIVNKGRKSQTPLTARPPSSPVEQCEITIENCCNMNICETPCFEPNLRTSKPSSASKKTEDRRQLLKNMEVEPSCSD